MVLRLAQWFIVIGYVAPSILGGVTGNQKLLIENILISPNYLFFSVATCLILWNWIKNQQQAVIPAHLLIIVAAFFWMILLGVYKGHELKWIVVDCFAFGGLLIGTMWAVQIKSWDLIAFTRNMCLVFALMIVSSFIGQWLGIIGSSRGASRDLDNYSILWVGVGSLIFFMPTFYVARRLALSRFQRVIFGASILFIPVMGITLAIYLVNRGNLVATILVVAITILIHSQDTKRSIFVLLSTVTVSLLLLTLVVIDDFWIRDLPQIQITQKVTGTNILKENRASEVFTIIELIQDNEFTGLGFGSQFVNELFRKYSKKVESGKCIAPHLGAFAFLQKGGYPIYICFVVVPFFFAAYRFLGPVPKDEVSLALWSQVLLYLTLSSCSTGGWAFSQTFFYGAFFTRALQYHPAPSLGNGRWIQ